MRRTPLRRKTPMARSPMRRRSRPVRVPASDITIAEAIRISLATPVPHEPSRHSGSAYRQRERHVPYMLWCKRMPCLMRGVWGTCSGPVEADHAGPRPLGQKAHDSTVIPLCHQHHMAERFPRSWLQAQRRAWLHAAIVYTQALARSLGVEVPIDPEPVVEYPAIAIELARHTLDGIAIGGDVPNNLIAL